MSSEEREQLTNVETGANLSPARWNYLKSLRPGPGRYVHTSAAVRMIPQDPLPPIPWIEKPGHTYNVGRNKAKRARRAALAKTGA